MRGGWLGSQGSCGMMRLRALGLGGAAKRNPQLLVDLPKDGRLVLGRDFQANDLLRPGDVAVRKVAEPVLDTLWEASGVLFILHIYGDEVVPHVFHLLRDEGF